MRYFDRFLRVQKNYGYNNNHTVYQFSEKQKAQFMETTSFVFTGGSDAKDIYAQDADAFPKDLSQLESLDLPYKTCFFEYTHGAMIWLEPEDGDPWDLFRTVLGIWIRENGLKDYSIFVLVNTGVEEIDEIFDPRIKVQMIEFIRGLTKRIQTEATGLVKARRVMRLKVLNGFFRRVLDKTIYVAPKEVTYFVGKALNKSIDWTYKLDTDATPAIAKMRVVREEVV